MALFAMRHVSKLLPTLEDLSSHREWRLREWAVAALPVLYASTLPTTTSEQQAAQDEDAAAAAGDEATEQGGANGQQEEEQEQEEGGENGETAVKTPEKEAAEEFHTPPSSFSPCPPLSPTTSSARGELQEACLRGLSDNAWCVRQRAADAFVLIGVCEARREKVEQAAAAAAVIGGGGGGDGDGGWWEGTFLPTVAALLSEPKTAGTSGSGARACAIVRMLWRSSSASVGCALSATTAQVDHVTAVTAPAAL